MHSAPEMMGSAGMVAVSPFLQEATPVAPLFPPGQQANPLAVGWLAMGSPSGSSVLLLRWATNSRNNFL